MNTHQERIEQAQRDASDGTHVATISGADFGMRDFHTKRGLWFATNWGEGNCLGALQCFWGEEMERMVMNEWLFLTTCIL